ncbi:hypothetical protein [Halospeciosus flavus]|uniref:hypothetical protein n=1 Tax=Halospeciosus flavus TaxID=3032283 RepID=UPI00360605CE
MSDRRLSRRQIIAGLSAVGLAGGFSSAALGRGTLSYLRDTEVLDSTLRGGEFDLVVEWDHHGKTGVADGTTVTLPLGTLDADTREDAATMTVSSRHRTRTRQSSGSGQTAQSRSARCSPSSSR